MGGRGTYAAGNNVAFSYKTVGTIDGVKVLQGLGNIHKLPEEAHSSNAYIGLDRNGNFKVYREYDKDRYLTFEIAYHAESKLDKSNKSILHAHDYKRDMKDRTTRLLTDAEFQKYKKYFKGVL